MTTTLSTRTPFLDVQSFVLEEREAPIQLSREVLGRSPFVSVYELEDGSYFEQSSQADAMAALVSDLYSEEFEEALENLYSHTRQLHDESMAAGMPAAQSERVLSQRFAELTRESEAMLDRMAREIDLNGVGELEHFAEDLTSSAPLEPAFEEFVGKLFKKVKSAVRKAASAVKNLALGPILNKLKGLIRPLLNQVLQKAIGKLPASLQPVARKLGEKLGILRGEPTQPDSTSGAEPASAEPTAAEPAGDPVQESVGQSMADVQQEFDEALAHSFLATEEAEIEFEVAQVRSAALVAADPVFANLDEARERFIHELESLKEGESPQPYVENFLPAAMAAVRVGLKLIGRQRVVNFLAGLLAKLVQRLVGPEQAPALSRAIVDAGMKFLSLEVGEEERSSLAASSVAATVEETINRVASLPGYVLEDQELLEAFALEAFEHAAAANLPALFSESTYKQRPELLEGGVNASWIMLPLRGRRRYKKCTRTFQVTITPQLASEVASFEDESLADYLHDQAGIPEGESVEAELHLYETLPGTTASDIVNGENRGDSMASIGGADELHPLTREAAGSLLGRPALGREAPVGTGPNRLPAGQRLYRIALPGRRPSSRGPGGARVRQRARVYLTLDAVRSQLRVTVFLSEVKAQRLALQARQNAHHGALVASFTRFLAQRIPPRLRGLRPQRVRIVHGALGDVNAAIRRMGTVVPEQFVSKVQEWLVKGFSDFLRNQAAQFQAAAEQPVDGVTLLFTIERPLGLAEICDALAGRAVTPDKVAKAVSGGEPSSVSVAASGGRTGD